MEIALGLAGMELIFSIAACMVLCSRLVTKPVLVKHSVLGIAEQCLHSIKAFSFSDSGPRTSRLGVGKGLGGDTARTADPDCLKGYPVLYDIMLSNQFWGKDEEGGDVCSRFTCLPK